MRDNKEFTIEPVNGQLKEIASRILEVLTKTDFPISLIESTKRKKRVDTKKLQENIIEYLDAVLPEAHFTKEQEKASEDYNTDFEDIDDYLNEDIDDYSNNEKPHRDRIDIYGKLYDTNIVIELDSSRADQVAKKMLSRCSMFVDDKLIYIAIIYPGTESMNLKEVWKYISYGKKLLNAPNKRDIIGLYFDITRKEIEKNEKKENTTIRYQLSEIQDE